MYCIFQSWNAYVDNLISHSKDGNGCSHIDKGAIIGLDGGAAWTAEEKDKVCNNLLCPTPEEGAKIAKCFKDNEFSAFQANGVTIQGVKYQFLRQLDTMVLAKKKDCGSLTLQASKTAIVVAHCPEGGQQGFTNKAVGVIADYLESQNM